MGSEGIHCSISDGQVVYQVRVVYQVYSFRFTFPMSHMPGTASSRAKYGILCPLNFFLVIPCGYVSIGSGHSLQEAGADAGYVEAPRSIDELTEIAKRQKVKTNSWHCTI